MCELWSSIIQPVIITHDIYFRYTHQGSDDSWVTLASQVGRAGAVKTDVQGVKSCLHWLSVVMPPFLVWCPRPKPGNRPMAMQQAEEDLPEFGDRSCSLSRAFRHNSGCESARQAQLSLPRMGSMLGSKPPTFPGMR